MNYRSPAFTCCKGLGLLILRRPARLRGSAQRSAPRVRLPALVQAHLPAGHMSGSRISETEAVFWQTLPSHACSPRTRVGRALKKSISRPCNNVPAATRSCPPGCCHRASGKSWDKTLAPQATVLLRSCKQPGLRCHFTSERKANTGSCKLDIDSH